MASSNNRIVRTNAQSWAPLPLRLALGVVFFAHGAQKLFGWFGGGGIQGTGEFFSNAVGLNPGPVWATLVGIAEFGGGLLTLIGAFTRIGAAAIALVMLGAIFMVHSHAFFANNQGMEFPLTLLLVAIALMITGGGAASVDAGLQKK